MKATKQARALPKARVMWGDPSQSRSVFTQHNSHDWRVPIVCLPLSSPKQARQLVQWANLTSEQRVEQVAWELRQMSPIVGTYADHKRRMARKVLSLLGMDSPHNSGEQK